MAKAKAKAKPKEPCDKKPASASGSKADEPSEKMPDAESDAKQKEPINKIPEPTTLKIYAKTVPRHDGAQTIIVRTKANDKCQILNLVPTTKIANMDEFCKQITDQVSEYIRDWVESSVKTVDKTKIQELRDFARRVRDNLIGS